MSSPDFNHYRHEILTGFQYSLFIGFQFIQINGLLSNSKRDNHHHLQHPCMDHYNVKSPCPPHAGSKCPVRVQAGTSLMGAAENGHEAVVRLLIEHKAEVNAEMARVNATSTLNPVCSRQHSPIAMLCADVSTANQACTRS